MIVKLHITVSNDYDCAIAAQYQNGRHPTPKTVVYEREVEIPDCGKGFDLHTVTFATDGEQV